MALLPRHARQILFFTGGVALCGMVLAWWLGGTVAGQPDPRNTYSAFYVLFARDEFWGLGLVATFSLSAALFFSEKMVGKVSPFPRLCAQLFRHVPIFVIAAAVFAIAALGARFVCRHYALSADEFMSDFQAQIFLQGKITAEVPSQWVPAVRVVKPTYVDYLPKTHSWKATYLPVYAAMRAIFQAAYLQSLLNPVLAALTVLALYGTVRNVWPDERQDAFVAALLLGTSAQFLVMAMTSYSMPAHLAFNTVWLWLYSRSDSRRFYLAPFVGVLAIGLHQPIVHAVFVAPFLFRLVLERRWRAVLIYGLVYLFGCAGWFIWRVIYSPPSAGAVTSFFRLWNPSMLVIQPMDLLLVIGWSALATPLLVVLGLKGILYQRPIIQDAAISCLLTFGFYYFFYLDQGHGWGYRYFHGTISCLIIVAVAGWRALRKSVGLERWRAGAFLAVSLIVSLVAVLPLRCYQAESFIRPYARASQAIHSVSVGVVGLDPHFAWYSADLIRNDPFLKNRPIVAALIDLRPSEVDALKRGGTARFVSRAELEGFGLTTTPPEPRHYNPFRLGYAR